MCSTQIRRKKEDSPCSITMKAILNILTWFNFRSSIHPPVDGTPLFMTFQDVLTDLAPWHWIHGTAIYLAENDGKTYGKITPDMEEWNMMENNQWNMIENDTQK